MCSILVFAKSDNIHPNPNMQWQKFGRGDVIDVRDEDDFFWGNDIETLGWWRIIILPGVPASQVHSLTSSEVLNEQDLENSPRKIRINKIDLDVIEEEEKTNKGKSKLEKHDKISHTLNGILSKITMKPGTNSDGSDIG